MAPVSRAKEAGVPPVVRVAQFWNGSGSKYPSLPRAWELPAVLETAIRELTLRALPGVSGGVSPSRAEGASNHHAQLEVSLGGSCDIACSIACVVTNVVSRSSIRTSKCSEIEHSPLPS